MEILINELKEKIIEALNLEEMTPDDIQDDEPLFGSGLGLDFQLYHDCRAGRQAGYAKFETFPIWNLPLIHPVNIAYEAAR